MRSHTTITMALLYTALTKKDSNVCHIKRLSITETALCIHFNFNEKFDLFGEYSEKTFVRHNMNAINLIEILAWQNINDEKPAIVDGEYIPDRKCYLHLKDNNSLSYIYGVCYYSQIRAKEANLPEQTLAHLVKMLSGIDTHPKPAVPKMEVLTEASEDLLGIASSN